MHRNTYSMKPRTRVAPMDRSCSWLWSGSSKCSTPVRSRARNPSEKTTMCATPAGKQHASNIQINLPHHSQHARLFYHVRMGRTHQTSESSVEIKSGSAGLKRGISPITLPSNPVMMATIAGGMLPAHGDNTNGQQRSGGRHANWRDTQAGRASEHVTHVGGVAKVRSAVCSLPCGV